MQSLHYCHFPFSIISIFNKMTLAALFVIHCKTGYETMRSKFMLKLKQKCQGNALMNETHICFIFSTLSNYQRQFPVNSYSNQLSTFSFIFLLFQSSDVSSDKICPGNSDRYIPGHFRALSELHEILDFRASGSNNPKSNQ